MVAKFFRTTTAVRCRFVQEHGYGAASDAGHGKSFLFVVFVFECVF